jgi:hypothetical protein
MVLRLLSHSLEHNSSSEADRRLENQEMICHLGNVKFNYRAHNPYEMASHLNEK